MLCQSNFQLLMLTGGDLAVYQALQEALCNYAGQTCQARGSTAAQGTSVSSDRPVGLGHCCDRPLRALGQPLAAWPLVMPRPLQQDAV